MSDFYINTADCEYMNRSSLSQKYRSTVGGPEVLVHQCITMPFSLVLVPRLTTEMVAQVIHYLRSHILHISIYIDNLMIMS